MKDIQGIGKTEQPRLNNPLSLKQNQQNGSPKYHRKRKQIKRSLWD